MTRAIASEAAPDTGLDPRLARALWQALALAVLAVAIAPTLLGPGHAPGLAAAWLVALPAIALATAHRHALRSRFAAAFERGRASGSTASSPGPDAPATAHRRRLAAGRGPAARAPGAVRRLRTRRAA